MEYIKQTDHIVIVYLYFRYVLITVKQKYNNSKSFAFRVDSVAQGPSCKFTHNEYG